MGNSQGHFQHITGIVNAGSRQVSDALAMKPEKLSQTWLTSRKIRKPRLAKAISSVAATPNVEPSIWPKNRAAR